MRLPEKLPPLGEPSFVLANPVALHVTTLVAILAAALGGLAWSGFEIASGRGDLWRGVVFILALAGLSVTLHPRNWRRWVVFAADPSGVYLARFSGDFVQVPWADVGPSEIGIAGRGSNRQRTVILPLRLDAETFERLLGKHQKRALRAEDAEGYVPYGIGNAMRNVEDTQRQIELIRRHAPHGAQ